MIFSERLKTLRKEKNWSQADLATKIDSDARQISQYETGKISPSIEGLIKIAKALDVSLDYLVLEEAPRTKGSTENNEFLDSLKHLNFLEDKDKNALKLIIDALIKKNKMKELIEKDTQE